MQNRLITLLSCFSFLLSGCSSFKNENAIHSIMNTEGSVIELKAENLEYMINQQYSFSVLLYTDKCSYCTKAKENLTKLSESSGYAFYQIEMYSASINYLSEKLPTYFSSEDVYPFMYIFNQGNISYKTSVEDLTNMTNLKKMTRSYLIDTSIMNLTSLEYYNVYKKDHSSYLLFAFDSSQKDEKDIYAKYIYSRAIQKDKNVLIIDKMTAKSDLISEINKEYSEGFDILSIYSFGQIKTTLRYASESGSNIDNFIASYF